MARTIIGGYGNYNELNRGRTYKQFFPELSKGTECQFCGHKAIKRKYPLSTKCDKGGAFV